MLRKALLIALAIVPFHCLPVLAQSYTPAHILFKGDTGYTSDELLAFTSLKKGAPLTQADMNDRTKQLMDTGLFEDVSFAYKNQDLVFQLTPVTALYPVTLENIPLSGPDVDAHLHARLPLYHGKLPAGGSIVDQVSREIAAALKEKGIAAEINAAPYTDPELGVITSEKFTITSPEITLGTIQLSGASAEFASPAASAASRVTGNPYSAQGSTSQIESALNHFYGERGYIGASYQIAPAAAPIVDATGVHVPFTVTVTEGPQFHLGSITLAPELVVTQQAFDKQSGLRSGEVVSPEKLRENWGYITRQYHNKGYMHARITPQETIDHSAATVSYTVTAVPGPVYTMGILRVDNVADDLRAAIAKAWPVSAGAPFNEGAILSMTATNNVNPALERVFAQTTLHYSLNLHDDTHTVDLTLRLDKKRP